MNANPDPVWLVAYARILSQTIKKFAAMGTGKRAIVSICANGGLETVALPRS